MQDLDLLAKELGIKDPSVHYRGIFSLLLATTTTTTEHRTHMCAGSWKKGYNFHKGQASRRPSNRHM